MKVFASGTANILQAISSGYHKIIPIHSLYFNYVGVNFLGLFNNIKQHIQFIKFIKGEITIPNELLPEIFAAYNIGFDNFSIFDSIDIIPTKINNIKNNFDDCEWFIFEIESLDYYIKTINDIDYQVSYNFSKDAIKYTQTEEDLINDITTLISLIPPNKNILFQTSYYRNNIIYNSLISYNVYEPKYIFNKETYYNSFNEIYYTYLIKSILNIPSTTDTTTTTDTSSIDTNNTSSTDTSSNTNNTSSTDTTSNTNNTTSTSNSTSNSNTNNTSSTDTTSNTNNTSSTDTTSNTNNTSSTDTTSNTNNTSSTDTN